MSRPRFSGEVERRLRAELSNPDKPLRVSLTGHGSNNRVPVGRLWPGFGVVAFDSSTMVGLLLDAEDLGRAHRVGSRVMIDVPVESIEFLKLKVLEENQGRRKPMERIRAAWSGIWSTKRNPPEDEEVGELRKRVAELERDVAWYRGVNVDVAPFGFFGTELPPCPPNAITTCRIGPDLFAAYLDEVDDEEWLRVDLIEANYFGHDKDPAYTDTQERMMRCVEQRMVIIRWIDFHVTPKGYRERKWTDPYEAYWRVRNEVRTSE